jgi:penicillin-binding protein 2
LAVAQVQALATDTRRLTITADRAALARMSDAGRTRLFDRLGALLGQSPRTLELRTVSCQAPEAQRLGLHGPDCFNGRTIDPAVLADSAQPAQALRIAENAEDYPGIDVSDRVVRAYPEPDGAVAGNVLGFLTLATTDDIAAAKKAHRPIDTSTLVGRAGLEARYDLKLRGTAGSKSVLVDRDGNAAGIAGKVAPVPGDDVATHLDARVQALVEQQLRRAMADRRAQIDPTTNRPYEVDSGAAVVLNTRTGAVVAMASAPSYDPSMFVDGLSAAQANQVFGPHSGSPTLNRAISGQYAPGSTFKLFTTAGALNAGYDWATTKLPCPGKLKIGGRYFTNNEMHWHPPMNFTRAVAVSCDTFFYRIAVDLWAEDGGANPQQVTHEYVDKAAESFGLGRATGIDLPGEATGQIPDRTWRYRYWLEHKAARCKQMRTDTSAQQRQADRDFCLDAGTERAGDAALTAIGQGEVLVTPLQMAVAYAAMANGGTLWTPQVAAAIRTHTGKTVRTIEPKVAGHVSMSSTDVGHLYEALKATARSGTPHRYFRGVLTDKLGLGAKTGTAQVAGKQATGWLATVNPDYAVVMVLTQAGAGNASCGPAVQAIWNGLYGVSGNAIHADAALAPAARVQAAQRGSDAP